MHIAILGAPRTGKTQLAHALNSHLKSLGVDIHVQDVASPDSLNRSDLVLLCGLDLTTATEHQLTEDIAIRAMLMARQQPFQVVYGQGPQRLENALYCIGRQFPHWATPLTRTEITPKWQGACETCGDGDCEHRLFTRLVQG